jgi:peptidyl-tRNA hydrolase, PTH1 family
MALFMKKTQTGSHTPLYTIGSSKTILVVGLGNIGKDYDGTRHNIGFAAVDYYAQQQDFGTWTVKKDLKAAIAVQNVAGTRVILAKPTTFMNLSGDAVQAVAHFYKVSVADILIVHDELDIDFGKIRTSIDGSAAGHNGIKSVIAVLGENFGRVRIGVGPKKPAQIDSADFVLASFTAAETKKIPATVKEAASIISDFSAAGSLYVETRSVLG